MREEGETKKCGVTVKEGEREREREFKKLKRSVTLTKGKTQAERNRITQCEFTTLSKMRMSSLLARTLSRRKKVTRVPFLVGPHFT